VQRIHPIHAANIWPFFVNGAGFTGHVVVPARSIAAIQKPGFIGKVNALAAQAALGAGALLHKASLRRVTPNPSRSYATVTV
jgi:hypothetical protein